MRKEDQPIPEIPDLSKYRKPVEKPQTFSIQAPPQLTREQILKNDQIAAFSKQKQSGLEQTTFSYLDLFEKQIAEHRMAQEQFTVDSAREEKKIEENKPAFFQNEKKATWREEEYEAWKKLQTQTNMNFNPDEKSTEELRNFFKLDKDKSPVDDMTDKIFEHLHERLRTRQISFYAYLNTQFNIMNFKSARCSMHCFDSVERPIRQVNTCLQVCRQGIKECSQFAHNKQKQAQDELEICQEEAKNQKNLTDPIIHWISCYEKLVSKFDKIETEISDEFSNFI